MHDTVSIIPMENAKTFVNGNLISESTVLHHVSKAASSNFFVRLSLHFVTLCKSNGTVCPRKAQSVS